MKTNNWSWTHLVPIPHPWRKGLYIKGRKLSAATVWTAMMVNSLSREDAADNWNLPVDAIDEIIEYCESNKKLIQRESAEEGRRLALRGIKVEPEAAH